MSNKRPGDRMCHIVLPFVGLVLLVAGLISGNTGVMWICLFLSLILSTITATSSIISAADNKMYQEVDDQRRALQRQVESLQRENRRLEEKNNCLGKKVADLEEANMRTYFLKW